MGEEGQQLEDTRSSFGHKDRSKDQKDTDQLSSVSSNFFGMGRNNAWAECY